MRRVAFLLTFAAILAVLAPVALGNATQPSAYASLSGFACRQARDPLNRVVTITATMREMPGTMQMALRFTLLQRLPGQRPHQIHGGDLGRWKALSVGPWAITKPVVNLPGPAVYRFRVSFRWLGASGQLIGFQTLASPTCSQPQ